MTAGVTALSASPEDFDELYAARAPGLVQSLYGRTGDMDRSQECVQEAFIRAWMRWSRLRDENPMAWVRTVAWNLAVSDWRSRDREKARLTKLGRQEEVPPKPIAEIVTIRQALSTLSPEQQTVIVLHYFEDMSVADIADLAAMKVGTVKSHLHRGRAALRLLLEPSLSQDGLSKPGDRS